MGVAPPGEAPGRLRATAGQRAHHGQGDPFVAAAGEIGLVALLTVGPGLGEVAFLAGAAGGVPQPVRVCSGCGEPRIQLGLLVVDGLAAGHRHGPHGRSRTVPLVVVIEVFIGQRAELREERLREEPAFLKGREGGRVGEQPGQQIPAAGLQPVQPAQVVQPVVAHAVEPSVRQGKRRPRGPPGAPARPRNRRSR